MKDSFIEGLRSANYYSTLTNGSTDSRVLQQEVVYALWLSDGEPAVKFLSIKTPDHTHADGLKESAETTFQNIGKRPMYNSLTTDLVFNWKLMHFGWVSFTVSIMILNLQ